jgi:hypothetical protein
MRRRQKLKKTEKEGRSGNAVMEGKETQDTGGGVGEGL